METERQENLDVGSLLQDTLVDVHGVLELVDANCVLSHFVTSRVQRVQHLVRIRLDTGAYLGRSGLAIFSKGTLDSLQLFTGVCTHPSLTKNYTKFTENGTLYITKRDCTN